MTHTDVEWRALHTKVKQLVPKRLGPMMIIVGSPGLSLNLLIGANIFRLQQAATVVASPSEELLAEFYSYLVRSKIRINIYDYVDSDSDDDVNDIDEDEDMEEDDDEGAAELERARQAISLIFREVLLKLIPLVGAPRVLCALIPLANAEGNVKAKAANSELDDRWDNMDHLDAEVFYQRGERTMKAIYGTSLLPKIFDSFGDHKEDISFHEIFAVYGLFLSDYAILTPIQTEAVVYATISSLGLGAPGTLHLRGMGRILGASGQDTQSDEAEQIITQLTNLREAVMEIIRFVGDDYATRARLDKWATVDSMLREFGGWGEKETLNQHFKEFYPGRI
ncbi:hypothetical protein N7532_011065 [Penicillium argentinense]|uniref:Uncharacterized protein n=1 Tax=Penicillium argentinense TaxID=1131581 RepID=A0A9W9JUW5_9EURO|nr:uncharacterized protein N7532_011065 [Penicillium argentinense]KAJ5082022.1 hypothetical protein N7532_011065 [Penicillium argentinense]